MAKQSYGTSTGGVNRSEKGDLPSDRNTMSYGRGPLTDLSTKGSLPSDRKFGGAYGPAPKAVGGKTAVEKPASKLPAPTGVETVTQAKTKNIPRTYVPTLFKPKPPAVAKPPAKKPPAAAKPTTRGATAPTKKATPRNMPPATRFGTVTGKTTGTTVRGGGGYGGGGTRGGGSLSGQGSGSRTAGTSRAGGTQRNDPTRG
jgi:hypothetical protein